MALVNCSCSPVVLPCCTRSPLYVMETPMMLSRAADVPFWIWIIVAGGALLVIILLVLIIVTLCLCRAQRNYFWCCCFVNDDSTATFVDKVPSQDDYAYGQRGDGGGKKRQVLFRAPEDDLVNLGYASGQAMNGDYVPRAQRLISARSSAANDGFRTSTIGSNRSHGPVVTEYIDVDEQANARYGGSGNQLSVVAIGNPSSAISAAPRPPSVMGQHSASFQIGNGRSAAAPTSIWPAL